MREYPQAIETEKALLSALMLDVGAIIPAVAELIIAKNRNGATATIRLHFCRELTRFDNLTRDGND